MTPLELLMANAEMRCTACGRKAGTCYCWVKCSCGWSFRRGSACHNQSTKKCSGKLNWRSYLKFLDVPKRDRVKAKSMTTLELSLDGDAVSAAGVAADKFLFLLEKRANEIALSFGAEAVGETHVRLATLELLSILGASKELIESEPDR